MTETFVLLLRVVLSLGVVLGLLWFLARRVNGQFSRGRAAPINVVARTSLSRHAGLAVVEVDERRLLLGVADTGVTLIAELDPDKPGEPGEDSTLADGAAGEDSASIREFIHGDLAAAIDDVPPLSAQGRAARRAKHAWDRELVKAQEQEQEQEAPAQESLLSAGTWRRAWESVQGRR